MPFTPAVEKSGEAEGSFSLRDDHRQMPGTDEAMGRGTNPGKHFPQSSTEPQNSAQVRKILGISFLVLMAILLTTAYLTVDRMERMNAGAQDALNQSLLELQLAQDGLRYSAENSRTAMQIFLVQRQEVVDQLLARRNENSRKTSALISDLESRYEPGEEAKLLEAVKEARDIYLDSYERAIHLLLIEKRRDAATEVMLQQTTPALYRYHTAWDEFLRFQKEQVKLASEHSKQQSAIARRLALESILVAGLLGGVVALMASRKVGRLVKSHILMRNEVYRLNTELEQTVAQRDRQLVHTRNQMQSSLSELREHTRRIEAVNQFVELLQSCLTLEEAYQQSALVLGHFFPAGTLLMLNPSRNLLEVATSWGATSAKPGPFPPDSCWGLRKGQVHAAEPGNFGLLCGHVDPANAACHLCVPMVAQGDSLGVLSVVSPVACDEASDAHLVEARQELAINLAGRISLAFGNLMLRETLKYQAVRDPLTGLFNRRHMEEFLDRELLRSARSNKTTAVLMADIDHFKQFNDAFGHEAGDVLLRELGSVLSSEVRGGDVACRYGGEEFLLILPDTDLQVARERAGRLNEQARNMHVRLRGETLRRITLSIGIAGFPQHGATPAKVLTAADQALYRAKAAGRNQVAVADNVEALARIGLAAD